MALLALLIQLGLAFGHVHAHAHHPSLAAASDTEPGAAAPVPPDDEDDHESHYCAIYALKALLSGAQTASTPDVLPPAVLVSAEIIVAVGAASIRPPRAAFNSRAPPLA